MSIMDNELYKFRQKVFNGKEANKVSHKSMVNITELNRQYFEKVTTDGTLIHAQSPLYGEQRQHTKYYKREGEPGNYRYYYTKEEWDAAHNQKKNESAMEKVQRMHNEKEPNVKGMIKDGIVYEKGEDGKFHKTDKNWDEMRKQAIEEADNKIINAAKEGGYEAAKKAIFDDERMDEMFTQFEGGFENHGWELNDDGSVTGMDDDDEKYFKKMEVWLRSFKDSTGIDIYKDPDFQKSVMDEIRKRYNLMKNQAKEKQAKIDGTKKYAAPAGVGKKPVSEETKETAKKAGENAGKAAKAGVAKTEFNKGLNDTITNEGADATADYIINNAPEFKALVRAYRQAVNNGQLKVYRDGGVTGKDNKELKKTLEPLFDDFDKVLKEAAKNPDFDRKGVEKLLDKELENIIAEATETKHGVRDSSKKFEHSALMTNSAMGDEIVDEYKAFQEKVKRGKEKNRLAHSATISPAMLNARYEEELGKKGILIHQANYKYYNKIDLGNGNTRYFYTKAEWDAYQREKGSKTNTNQKLSADTLKQIEQQKQKKEAYDKNKAADEAQKKAESDKWDTHKKIREDFHQVPGYMTYSSSFVDDMKATPEGSDKGKEYFSKVLNDAYEKYPNMKNIKTDAPKNAQKPKDEEVFAFMDEVQKGIDKYTKNFVGRYQLPEQEYTPIINNYFLSMTDQLMKDGKLDYDYVKDVYYRNSDIGKKETKAQEILKQGDFRDHVFPEQLQNKNMIDGLNRSTGQELVEKTEHSETYKGIDRDTDEEYQAALKSFAQTRPAQYIKEEYDTLKNRRTNDGKQQYSDEDIYNAVYKFLHKNVQQWAVKQDDFNPNIFYLIPDLLKTMGINGEYTADPQDLILKIK